MININQQWWLAVIWCQSCACLVTYAGINNKTFFPKSSLLHLSSTHAVAVLYAISSLHHGCHGISNYPSIGCLFNNLLYPPHQQSWKGGILVSPGQCVDRIVSTLYLQEYSSDPFHICTSYQTTSEGVSRVMPVSKFEILANFLNL